MIPLDGLRACRNPECRALLPLAEGFYPKGRLQDGTVRRDAYCKECRRVAERERYASLDESALTARRPRNAAAQRRLRRRQGMRARHSWERTRAPIGPFRDWLAGVVRVEERGVRGVADLVGVDEGFVRALLGRKPEVSGHGTAARGKVYPRAAVTLGTVERFLEAVGDGTRVETLYDLIELERIRLGRGPIVAPGRSVSARRRTRVKGRFAPA